MQLYIKTYLKLIKSNMMTKTIFKVIKQGLHNRVTMRMRLLPFTLKECEDFSIVNNLNYSRKDILNLYLAIGGVAWYWTLLKKRLLCKTEFSTSIL